MARSLTGGHIVRDGIFLNQELLDLGLAKLYKDPSSAPVKPDEAD